MLRKHLVFENTTDMVFPQTNGRGVDHILEVGGPGTIMKSVNAIRFGGTISLIGIVAGLVRTFAALQHLLH